MKIRRQKPCHNTIWVADNHGGCQLALCPRGGVDLDNGGRYMPSAFQLKLLDMWNEFWGQWVPEVTQGEPFAVFHLGDALDGRHHQATTQISQNLNDQHRIALALLKPVVAQCEGRYFHTRGTPVHVGESGEAEEDLARELGAIPDSTGRFARNEIWVRLGPRLIHGMHHISATGVAGYEATAPHREYVDGLVEAGRWGQAFADVEVRAHRHRHIQTSMPTAHGEGYSVVVPGWQGKTPWLFKIPGARQSEPQFGGVLVRWSEKNRELFVRAKVWSLARPKPERL